MTAICVRREKATLSSGCKSHPACEAAVGNHEARKAVIPPSVNAEFSRYCKTAGRRSHYQLSVAQLLAFLSASIALSPRCILISRRAAEIVAAERLAGEPESAPPQVEAKTPAVPIRRSITRTF
jgi:hypothetical protein